MWQRTGFKIVPHFRSLDELVEFFDTQDMGDYLKDMPEAKFDVNIKRRTHLFALDAELASKLTEIASRSKHLQSRLLMLG